MMMIMMVVVVVVVIMMMYVTYSFPPSYPLNTLIIFGEAYKL
jgi:hypothetical protein